MAKDAGGGGITIKIQDVFGPIGKVIETAALAEQVAAEEKLRALKNEVAKGKQADNSVFCQVGGGSRGTCSRSGRSGRRCVRDRC
jgi:hypothetical protein